MAPLLACALFCQVHLYETGAPARDACRCCDRDGCDVVERNAPRPMVITVVLKTEPVAIEEPKDDRPEFTYDADK